MTHLNWPLSRGVLLIISIHVVFIGGEIVHKDLIDCIQKEKCGLFSICSYSLVFDEPCVSGKNCSESSTNGGGLNEMTAEGNIMLLKNGLDHIIDYTWNVVGYNHDTKTDDVTARKYVLPAFSYAYFDSGIPFHHTVRLISGGETIDTKISSKKECTRHEACQYLLRSCQSSFVYVNTNSMQQRTNCLLYGKACGYFLHLPDLSSSSSSSSSSSNPTKNEDNLYDSGRTPMEIYKEGASTCVVDCIWSWYPTKWLPTRPMLKSLIDSLDMVRRVHYGKSMELGECKKDIVFTDDKIEIFHTTQDDELLLMLNRDGNSDHSNNKAAVAWLSIFLTIVLISFILFVSYIYYVKYYKKQKSLFSYNKPTTSLSGYNMGDEEGDAILL